MQSFQELKLPEELARALVRMKFTTPTPIQAQAIPYALAGRDVLGCAQTGTGKTAAFSIPTLVNILQNQQKSALVLAPTRELAQQIAEVVRALLVHAPQIRCVVVIGGAGMQGQVKALAKRPHFIIATPGRLCDHLERRSVDLRNVGTLILDEADRMLDMGFAPQLGQILRSLPQQRQTLLFSATMAPEVQKLAMQMLRDPAQVTVGAISRPIEKIEQEVLTTTAQEKNNLLLDQINAREGSMLIFARTQVRTDRLSKYLASFGLPVTRIHGGRSQGQRNQAIAGFKDGTFRILVATDIAARGIDISHIAHVINYDLPMVPEDYVHRIGRTARAGATGKALSLVTGEEKGLWRDIQRLLDKSAKGGTPAIKLSAGVPSANRPVPTHPVQGPGSQARPQGGEQQHRHSRPHRKGGQRQAQGQGQGQSRDGNGGGGNAPAGNRFGGGKFKQKRPFGKPGRADSPRPTGVIES